MRNFLIGLVFGFALLPTMVSAEPGKPDPADFQHVQSCRYGSGPKVAFCAWDGQHDGHGITRSYVTNYAGEVSYVPHWVAHRLRNK